MRTTTITRTRLTTACALLAGTLATMGWTHAATSSASGPPVRLSALLVLVQRGLQSQQVQIGAGHDEILLAQGGRAHPIARGLTTPCCGLGGLAVSPDDRHVAFSQEAAGPGRSRAGLWVMALDGRDRHRIVQPPAPRQTGPLDLGSVAWSPQHDLLAYAANRYSDTPVTMALEAEAGVWIARSNGTAPRLLAPFVVGGRYGPLAAMPCHGHFATPIVTHLSWSPTRRTIVASVSCLNVAAPSRETAGIVAIDARTGRVRALVGDARDGESAPVSGRLAYVTESGPVDRLWVARPDGGGARLVLRRRAAISGPAWSPDEQAIAVIAHGPDRRTDVWSVNVASGRETTMLTSAQLGVPAPAAVTAVVWLKRI